MSFNFTPNNFELRCLTEQELTIPEETILLVPEQLEPKEEEIFLDSLDLDEFEF